ncbi:MAG: 5-(carboxyamino)imidazole ribonucleotide synthase [Pseudomonadota bacterium]
MRVGIVGGGQLGRMLGLAAVPLNVATVFLDPAEDACARVVGEQLIGEFSDPSALDRLAASCDVLTYEFENVDVAELQRIAVNTTVRPSVRAVEVSQQRHREKAFFEGLGLDVAPWAYAESSADLDGALATTGLPAILKTDRLGYDGKGQVRITEASQAAAAFERLGGVPICVEGVVPFDFEVSVIGSRGIDASTEVYALTENRHRDGILWQSRTVADQARLADVARQAFLATTAALDYVGTLAIEFFVVGERLLVNEFAPRVHNSGHWTLDGAVTSQFENHMRAVAGLPLGSARLLGSAGMQNFIGNVPPTAEILADPAVRLHAYGKQARNGRKVGHANVVADSAAQRDSSLETLANVTSRYETRTL